LFLSVKIGFLIDVNAPNALKNQALTPKETPASIKRRDFRFLQVTWYSLVMGRAKKTLLFSSVLVKSPY